jgi:IS5 family transposase
VWADTAYCSAANERFLAEIDKVSQIHRKKPRGKKMPQHTARANKKRSRIRSVVAHVFAAQESRVGPFIRTIGLARATGKTGLANLAYNMKRLVVRQGPRTGSRNAETEAKLAGDG